MRKTEQNGISDGSNTNSRAIQNEIVGKETPSMYVKEKVLIER